EDGEISVKASCERNQNQQPCSIHHNPENGRYQNRSAILSEHARDKQRKQKQFCCRTKSAGNGHSDCSPDQHFGLSKGCDYKIANRCCKKCFHFINFSNAAVKPCNWIRCENPCCTKSCDPISGELKHQKSDA